MNEQSTPTAEERQEFWKSAHRAATDDWCREKARAEKAEAALDRVRALAERWGDHPVSKQLRAALDGGED